MGFVEYWSRILKNLISNKEFKLIGSNFPALFPLFSPSNFMLNDYECWNLIFFINGKKKTLKAKAYHKFVL